MTAATDDSFFADTVRELGLDPEDRDWERIGWNWAEPRDKEAWDRLVERRLIES